jgi:hypothetical protein
MPNHDDQQPQWPGAIDRAILRAREGGRPSTVDRVRQRRHPIVRVVPLMNPRIKMGGSL